MNATLISDFLRKNQKNVNILSFRLCSFELGEVNSDFSKWLKQYVKFLINFLDSFSSNFYFNISVLKRSPNFIHYSPLACATLHNISKTAYGNCCCFVVMSRKLLLCLENIWKMLEEKVVGKYYAIMWRRQAEIVEKHINISFFCKPFCLRNISRISGSEAAKQGSTFEVKWGLAWNYAFWTRNLLKTLKKNKT